MKLLRKTLASSRLNRTRLGVLIAIVAIVGYGVLAEVSGIGNLSSALTELGLSNTVIIAALSLLNYAFRTLRWQFYLTRLRYRLAAGTNALCYMSGFAFTLTPGKAGEAGRGIHLKAYGVDYQATVAALLVERFMDLVAVLALAIAAMAVLPGFRWLIVGAVAVTLVIAVAMFALSRTRPLGEPQASGKWWQRASSRVRQTLQLIAPLLTTGTLLVGVLLSLTAWGSEAFGFYWLCVKLGVHIPLLTATGIYSASLLAGALSFLPGGLGTTEATMAGLLIGVGGASKGGAIGITLICRVLTLWLAIFLGILCNLYLETPLAPRTLSQRA